MHRGALLSMIPLVLVLPLSHLAPPVRFKMYLIDINSNILAFKRLFALLWGNESQLCLPCEFSC